MSDEGPAPNEQMAAYREAVSSGLYAKKTGLVGKYDNVRQYWEDEVTRQFLQPHLIRLLGRVRRRMRRLRIMDLGCGSADGFELLTGVRERESNLEDSEVDLLTPDVLGAYRGVDLSPDLLAQARGIYGRNPKVSFEQADFTEGLPLDPSEAPYDLYFTSYGTFSHHNEDETAVRLLADIAQRTDDYCLIVCDWLGRYSYEWQTLWTNDLAEHRNMDYIVSYIYEEEEREARRDELQHLLLRLMSRQEAEAVVAQASERAGVSIRPLVYFDRSVLTGRHMDTGEYNPHAQPMRRTVNSLHEANTRTDLATVKLDYVPRRGFDFLNNYFEHLQACWNTLIDYVQALLSDYDETAGTLRTEPPPPLPTYPRPLVEAMVRMRRVVEGVGWMGVGLPRENVIEPQLGYTLRNIVMQLQTGCGAGHGLCGILEVDKTEGGPQT